MIDVLYAVIGSGIFLGATWWALRAYGAARISRKVCAYASGVGLALPLAIGSLLGHPDSPLLVAGLSALVAVPAAAVMYAVAPSLADRSS